MTRASTRKNKKTHQETLEEGKRTKAKRGAESTTGDTLDHQNPAASKEQLAKRRKRNRDKKCGEKGTSNLKQLSPLQGNNHSNVDEDVKGGADRSLDQQTITNNNPRKLRIRTRWKRGEGKKRPRNK